MEGWTEEETFDLQNVPESASACSDTNPIWYWYLPTDTFAGHL